jgi:internalin A
MGIDLVSTEEEMAEISKSHLGGKPGKTPTVILAEVKTKQEEPVIFLSYSHHDDKWRQKLELVLSPLVKGQKLTLWTDKQIDPGAKWKTEIEKALARSKVAILLVSPHFLASDFISKHELPPLLERTRVLWIPVSASLYEATEIGTYQALIDPKAPLETFKGAKLNEKLVAIAKAISNVVASTQEPIINVAPL